MKNNVRNTITNENINQTNGTQKTECVGDVMYCGIKFPRKLIDEAKAVFMPTFKKEEITDELCCVALTKIARLEILLRRIREKQKK